MTWLITFAIVYGCIALLYFALNALIYSQERYHQMGCLEAIRVFAVDAAIWPVRVVQLVRRLF